MTPGGIGILAIFVPMTLYIIYTIITDKKKKAAEAARKAEEFVHVSKDSEDISKAA